MKTPFVMRSLRAYFLMAFALVCLSCGNTSEKKEVSEQKSESENSSKTVSKEKSKKVILCFGDSLTAGLGLETTEAYPALLQNRIDSLGYDYQVVNAGLSGDTTASGKSRLDWVLNQSVDIFLLELGANDGLRGIPLTETKKNLKDIITAVRNKYPEVEIILAGMQIPPNMGQDYTSEFRNIFPDLAKAYDLHLVPFLLEGVAGDPDLNQSDGIHPTAEGYEIVADNVWEVLKDAIDK